MVNTLEATTISKLFYYIDSSVRSDLHRGMIADERDYVSRLSTLFNYPFGIVNQYSFNGTRFQSRWFARVNPGKYEQKFGCDSMIVFKVNNKVKVGLFEAKWPRVIKNPLHNWDYLHKNPKVSHFTNQIERQAKWSNQAAIWEMLFYEEKVGTLNNPFDKYASTCIQHKYAKQFINSNKSLKRTIWNNNDLGMLINTQQKSPQNKSKDTNIKEIIYDILICKSGKVIDLEPFDREFELISSDGEKVICPIVTSFDNDAEVTLFDRNDEQRIDAFIEENGLSSLLQLNIITNK